MLKVFLVEDEIIMREGIKKNVDWSGAGFEFAGEAGDGELAYPLIQKAKPDILITDIKMPFMDGLELSRLVKQELPETRIILLSGYDEFQYAKEAIEIGIAEYLVKPVTSVQLLDAVKKVEQKIVKDKSKSGENKDDEEKQRQRLFRHMVSGKYPFSEVLKEAKEQGIGLAANAYNVMLLQIFSEEEETVFCEKVRTLLQKLERIANKTTNIIIAKQSREEYDFILKGTDELPLQQLTDACKNELADFFGGEAQMEYVAALGSPVERFSELKNCYEAASLSFSKRYLAERNQVIQESTEESDKPEDTAELKLGELNVAGMNRRQVEQFLYTGTRQEVSAFVEGYFSEIGNGNVQSILLRQYVMMDLYVVAVSVLEKSGYRAQDLVERCGDAKEMTAYLTTLEQTKAYVKKVFETVMELRENGPDRKYEGVLQKAKAYIEENFANDEISLNAVAAAVSLSPSHFSTIFGQEMGETFVEYLTGVRMEKAKQLLKTTGMKTIDIAFEVGYRDAHYFSNLFKKTQGCTPREYRNRA